MSKPSEKALEITKKWFLHNGNVQLERMNMTYPQKYRAKLVYELYNLFLADKDIDLMETAKRISARDYAQFLEQAKNENASTPPRIQELSQKYIDALKIKPGTTRSLSELSNDIFTLNYIVGQFDNANAEIAKVKVRDTYDWAMRESKKMGDIKSAISAADKTREMYDNFNEKKNAADDIPHGNINITGDVTVVKPDNKNLTEEELEKIYKKYGLSRKDIIEMKENGDGVFVPEDMEDNLLHLSSDDALNP